MVITYRPSHAEELANKKHAHRPTGLVEHEHAEGCTQIVGSSCDAGGSAHESELSKSRFVIQ